MEGIVKDKKCCFKKKLNALGGQVHDYMAKCKIWELGVLLAFNFMTFLPLAMTYTSNNTSNFITKKCSFFANLSKYYSLSLH